MQDAIRPFTLPTLLDAEPPILAPTGLQIQPFGEALMVELIAQQAEQAFAHRAEGAGLLLAADLPSTAEARAAVLGARQTGLPVLVTLAVDDEGNTAEGGDLLAAIAAVQHLGVAAAGLHCKSGRIDTLQLIGRVAPYMSVPLLVQLDAAGEGAEGAFFLSPEELYHYGTQALKAGAQVLTGGNGVTEAHRQALARAVADFEADDCVIEPDADALLMACDTEAFFLSPEDLQFSEEVFCRHDMTEEILAAEADGCDVLRIRVDSLEEAYNFAANAHMIRMPLCISSHNDEALEAALIAYNGRAFVDMRTEVEDSTLASLAAGYGAVML